MTNRSKYGMITYRVAECNIGTLLLNTTIVNLGDYMRIRIERHPVSGRILRKYEIPELTFDKIELAWAGGFFCGEGSSYLNINRGNPYLGMSIRQNDPECLYRFIKAVKTGKVKGPYQNAHPLHLPASHEIQTRNFEKVQYIIALLWPYLSTQKKDQYKKAISKYLGKKAA